MTPSLRRSLALPVVLAAVIGLSACGAESDSATNAVVSTTSKITRETTATTPEVTAVADEVAPVDDDDHSDDDDHDDHDDHDDESAGLGAHEHGTAELSVAWIDAEVAIDLISPTFNVFGFEYEPTTSEDLAIETDRTEAISAASIITINDEAGCTLVDPVETEVERDGSHSEITVSWLFVCDAPDQVEELDATQLFAEFPNFKDVDAQWISASDQSAAELSPSATTLPLRR